MWQWQTLARTSMPLTPLRKFAHTRTFHPCPALVPCDVLPCVGKFRATAAPCFKSLHFHSLVLFFSCIHSWFLSFKALASSLFLHPRWCMAHRSTFLYISCESSTTAILPPSTASTSSHPPAVVAAGVPSKGGKTHNRSKSRIMSLYNTPSSALFCDELCKPGRRLISNKCASGVESSAASPGTTGGGASRKSKPKNSK